jgi:lathosterol oxidase
MTSLGSQFAAALGSSFLFQTFRYFVLCGAIYFLFWVYLRTWTEKRSVLERPHQQKEIRRDMFSATGFNFITAIPVAFIAIPEFRSHTSIYFHLHAHSVLWAIATVPLLLLGQDAHIYWVHRLLHENKWLFRKIHITHHYSTNPSPFTTFAFHPVEGLMLAVFNILFIFLVPTYFGSFAVYQVAALLFNLNGHLGADLLPKRWKRHPLLRYLNRADLHGDHHRFYNWNYAPFFTHWDHWGGTFRDSADEVAGPNREK